MYATCETTGCSNAGFPIPVSGERDVVCGVCSQPITNLTATAPEPVKEMPTWA